MTFSMDKKLIKVYALFSFALGLSLWASFYSWEGPSFIYHSFFPSSLLVISYFFFLGGHEYWGEQLDKSSEQVLSYYLLFQCVCFAGTSIELHTLSPMLLCLIPASLVTMTATHESEKKKGPILFVTSWAFFMVMATIGSHWKGETSILSLLTSQDTLVFTCFSLCMLVFAWHAGLASRKAKDSFKNNSIPTSNEHLFFHDMVNHTHGMNLYLSHLVATKKGLSVEETQEVLHEVKMMQALIRDHYKWGHKNLDEASMFIEFHDLQKTVSVLMGNFLPSLKPNCRYENIKYEFAIPFSPFVRIMSNLFKNIAERKSSHIAVEFVYLHEGLRITVTNDMFADINHRDEQHLLSFLKNQISSSTISSDMPGMGLASIHSLCQQLGGTFTFSIQHSTWVSEVFLPRSCGQNSTDFKKAC